MFIDSSMLVLCAGVVEASYVPTLRLCMFHKNGETTVSAPCLSYALSGVGML